MKSKTTFKHHSPKRLRPAGRQDRSREVCVAVHSRVTVGSRSGHGRVPAENAALLTGQCPEAGATGNGSPIRLTQLCLYFEEIEFVGILGGGMNTAVSTFAFNLPGRLPITVALCPQAAALRNLSDTLRHEQLDHY